MYSLIFIGGNTQFLIVDKCVRLKSFFLVRFTISFLVFSLSANLNASEQKYSFTSIQPADGLSEGVVHCIFRDIRGFMWFGTQGGLNRYDGYKMKVYKKGTTIGSTPSNNQIISILEDKAGIMWIGTAGGLNRFDPEIEAFVHFHNNGSEANSGDNAIDALTELNESTLLAGTFSRLHTFNKKSGKFNLVNSDDENYPAAINEFLKLDDGSIIVASGTGLFVYDIVDNTVKVKLNKYNFEKLLGKNIWSIIQFDEDELWAANANGYFTINTKNALVKFVDIRQSGMDKDFQVRSILKDTHGDVWFGTNAGLLKYDPLNKKYFLFRNDPFNQKTISSDRISTMLSTQSYGEDKSGLLWIGTFGSGVNKINLNQKKFYGFEGNQKKGSGGLEFNFIMHIYGDAMNNLFVSSLDKGFAVYNRSKSKFFHHTQFLKKLTQTAGNIFYFAFPYDDNKYFVFDYQNIYSYSIDKAMSIKLNYSYPLSFNFSSMLRDSLGSFWGGDSWSVIRFRENVDQKTISNIQFYHIGEQVNHLCDDDSIIWIGAKGLIKLSKVRGTINKYLPSKYFSNKEISDFIYFIHNDKKGNLWLGTYGDGLIKFDKEKETFYQYTIYNGLPDNTVYGILEDRLGSLWLSTNKGLSKFDPKNDSFVNYDQSDGLINLEYNRRACYKDKNGIMYFGGVNGIDYFEPSEIQLNRNVPQIVITDFKLFNKSFNAGKEISFTDEINLSHDQNYFSFEFASLDYIDPSSNKFLYKLEGLDENWIAAGNDRAASYTHLNPGKYIFRVLGSNNDGVWSEGGAAVTIIISPPFWQTWWFRFFAASFIILAAGLILNLKIQKLKKEKEQQEKFSKNLILSQENERRRIARELHDSLGQNLLIIKNKAAGFLSGNRNNQENNTAADIESLALESLNEIREISYNLHPHQLEKLGVSKAIESIFYRLESSSNIKFNYRIERIDGLIPKELDINLFRLIQEAINNVIKHSGAKEASVMISLKNKIIHVDIEDNGKGFDVEERVNSTNGNYGLSDIFERTRVMGGKIEIKSVPLLGTSISIKIPVTMNETI